MERTDCYDQAATNWSTVVFSAIVISSNCKVGELGREGDPYLGFMFFHRFYQTIHSLDYEHENSVFHHS